MTTKIIYIAEDGEEFETEQECLQHEEAMNPDGAVVLFDEEMHPLYYDNVVELYERAMYIYIINSEKAAAFFDWIHDYTSYSVPHDFVDKGIYYYNEDSGEYEDFLQKFKEMEEQRDILMDHIEEVSK